MGDGESIEKRWREQIFFSTLLSVRGKKRQKKSRKEKVKRNA
jgi:hypothetical protein